MRTAGCCSILAGLLVILYYYPAFFVHTGPLEWAPLMLLGFFCMFLQAIVCGGVGPSVGATTQMVVPVHRKSLSFDVVMACGYGLGGGWGSGIAGMIADRLGTGQPGDWKGLAYGVMIVSCAAILGGIFWLRSASHYESDFKKVQQWFDAPWQSACLSSYSSLLSSSRANPLRTVFSTMFREIMKCRR